MDQDTFIMRSQELNYRCLQLGQSRAVRPAGQEGTETAVRQRPWRWFAGGRAGARHPALQGLAGTLSPTLVMKQDLTCRLLNKTYNWGNASQDDLNP